MPRTRQPEIFRAKDGFAVELDGEHIIVNKDELVRSGHALLRTHGDYFEAVDDRVKYDTEQATAAPGEKRGARTNATG